MTYHVKFTNAYKKGYKRAKKQGLNLQLIDDVVDELRQGHKLDAKYRDHALHGNWEGFRECHIQPDWLPIYLIEDDIFTLTLSETGTHSELFDEKAVHSGRLFLLWIFSWQETQRLIRFSSSLGPPSESGFL